MQKNEQTALLADKDVQRILQVAEGLLNGTKRLVIVSEATPDKVCTYAGTTTTNPEFQDVVHYKHTFKVEDCNAETE